MTDQQPLARDPGEMPDHGAAAAPLDFTCPRCEASVQAAFYGPCSTCRDQLRAAYQGERRAMERQAFEPAMHVTPNAVALKE